MQCRSPGFNPWVGTIPWRKERLPTPVFWPGEFHGLYSPWGHEDLDTTEWLLLTHSLTHSLHFGLFCRTMRATWNIFKVEINHLSLIIHVNHISSTNIMENFLSTFSFSTSTQQFFVETHSLSLYNSNKHPCGPMGLSMLPARPPPLSEHKEPKWSLPGPLWLVQVWPCEPRPPTEDLSRTLVRVAGKRLL